MSAEVPVPTQSPLSMEAFQRGDPATWDRFINESLPKINGTIYRSGVGIEDMEDVAQETYLKLWRTRASIDPERNIHAYACQGAKFASIDFHRRNGRIRAHEIQGLPMEIFSSDDDTESEGLSGCYGEQISPAVIEALDTLTPAMREVVIYTVNGDSPQEIVDREGLSKITIKTRLFRARQKLKEELEGKL